MKKITLMLGVVSMMALVSCKKETTTVETVTPVSENIDNVPPPPPPAPVVKDSVTDGTSISMDANGVKVDSKDGDRKTKVNVSGGDSSIEIKR